MEVDVTEARKALKQRRTNGDAGSLTAFVTACIARAVHENPQLHAYRAGRRLVLFDDVDVTIIAEQEVEGQKLPVPHIIRSANRRTVAEITDEIRRAREDDAIRKQAARWLSLWLLVPPFLRELAWTWLLRSPHRRKRYTGTVVVSALSMFGFGSGWAIPLPACTLAVTLGGLVRKPGVVGNEIAIREYLCLTLSVNHDVVDGAPAARFTRRIAELITEGRIESGI